MTVYVYTLGVAIEAEDEQAAWTKLAPISQQLDDIDIERDSSTDGPYRWDDEESLRVRAKEEKDWLNSPAAKRDRDLLREQP